MPGAAAYTGPVGVGANRQRLDSGTSALTATPAPAVTPSDRRAFDSAIQALQAELASVGAHGALDGATRASYAAQVKAAADELRRQALAGRISWRRAAEQAHALRDTVMGLLRRRSTPVGLAYAQWLKSEGPTLNSLIAKYTLKLHGPGADFNVLTGAQRNAVYAEVVAASGRANPRVTATMRQLSRAGRGLLVLSVAISVYEVASADDKLDAAGRELAVTGAGIAGGVAAGALAGVACGPGAPVCVALGAFVGGALAAFGSDWAWSSR